jgi:hypothetical protein
MARLGEFEKQIEASYSVTLEVLERQWNAAMSARYGGKLPRLSAEDEDAIRDIFSRQDAAAAAHDARSIEDSYDVNAKESIQYFQGNLRYYAELLERTEIMQVYDLGIKNGASALALTLRQFRNGRKFRITYRLEKLGAGWKIQEEEWLH